MYLLACREGALNRIFVRQIQDKMILAPVLPFVVRKTGSGWYTKHFFPFPHEVKASSHSHGSKPESMGGERERSGELELADWTNWVRVSFNLIPRNCMLYRNHWGFEVRGTELGSLLQKGRREMVIKSQVLGGDRGASRCVRDSRLFFSPSPKGFVLFSLLFGCEA